MKPIIVIAFFAFLVPGGAFAITADELYKRECWQIGGPPGETRYIEIHTLVEAPKTGIAHISILSRKKGAPVWEFDRLVPHLAITTEALRDSVIKPTKDRGSYPEEFEYEYARWKTEQVQGKAFVCEVPVSQYLASIKKPASR